MATDKQQLQMPDLPSVVQGDGRHVMALLRKYLKEMAVQINLANDFEGEPEQDTGLAAPAGFVLRFGVDGGELSWKDVPYLSSLAYYELRTDKNVGSVAGLLEQTTEITSTKLPVDYKATVYLYAVLKNGTYSNASVLTYTKSRPEAPQKINLTKNDQGTLIQFTEIPLDCMGANIYVNNEKFVTEDNIFLYANKSTVIETIAVAYFDQFGEGEHAIVYCDVPAVTDFIVERNGAVLDFYWTPLDLYGVQYAVQISESPVWGTGTELFTTKLNKKKMEYPNVGDKYFLIKAFDEHGNYSTEVTWYKLTSAEDLSRNHIITFDEQEAAYPNIKNGLWYDVSSGGLRFADGIYTGEYIFKGELPQEYRARNWTDYKAITTSAEEQWYVKDALYPLDDEWGTSITVAGGRITEGEAVDIKTYIATYEGTDTGDLFIASMDGTTIADTGETPSPCQHADVFKSGTWHTGLSVEELTMLAYRITNTVTQFSSRFCVKYESAIESGFIARWSGESGWIELSYDDGFCLNGSDGVSVYLPYTWKRLDSLTFCVSQGANERGLYIKSNSGTQKAVATATPIGVMTAMQFHKGEE